jgi:hypothetical protein
MNSYGLLSTDIVQYRPATSTRRARPALTKWMGISTAASVTDDAATPDLTRPQTSTGVGVSQLMFLAPPPLVSVAPALRTPCATTPERCFLADRRLACAHGCERKEAPPKIELKPHRFLHTENHHGHASPRGSSTGPVATLVSQQRRSSSSPRSRRPSLPWEQPSSVVRSNQVKAIRQKPVTTSHRRRIGPRRSVSGARRAAAGPGGTTDTPPTLKAHQQGSAQEDGL